MRKIIVTILVVVVSCFAFNDLSLIKKGNNWTYRYRATNAAMITIDTVVTFTIDSIYSSLDTTIMSINGAIHKCIGDTFFDYRGFYGNVKRKPIMFAFFNSDWKLDSIQIDTVFYGSQSMLNIIKQTSEFSGDNVSSKSLNKIGTYSYSTHGRSGPGTEHFTQYDLLYFNGTPFNATTMSLGIINALSKRPFYSAANGKLKRNYLLNGRLIKQDIFRNNHINKIIINNSTSTR